MKKLFSLLTFIVFAAFAVAQTPQAIISRMESEMNKHEKEGIVMTIDVKIPIIGTMTSKTYSLGDKMREEAEIKGLKIITWADGKTIWTYHSQDNEVEIKKQEAVAEAESDAELFSGITEGYDVTLEKETSKDWQFLCKKSKDNTDKDAPKKMELTIAKGTYMPISLKTKISGMAITMRDVSFGVTEKQVTFNAKDYPGVKTVDKR